MQAVYPLPCAACAKLHARKPPGRGRTGLDSNLLKILKVSRPRTPLHTHSHVCAHASTCALTQGYITRASTRTHSRTHAQMHTHTLCDSSVLRPKEVSGVGYNAKGQVVGNVPRGEGPQDPMPQWVPVFSGVALTIYSGLAHLLYTFTLFSDLVHLPYTVVARSTFAQ